MHIYTSAVAVLDKVGKFLLPPSCSVKDKKNFFFFWGATVKIVMQIGVRMLLNYEWNKESMIKSAERLLGLILFSEWWK